MAVRKKSLKRILNSYLLAQGDQPYKRLKLLQRYLKAKKIANVSIKDLRDRIKKMKNSRHHKEKLDKIEAKLFTKEGTPKFNRYGSAFCEGCSMYKDYEKECPYCGSLELTL